MYLTIKKIDQLCEVLEYPLDYFQKKHIYRSVMKHNTTFVSEMRQAGKTHELMFLAMLWCLYGGRVLYTAQELATVEAIKENFLRYADKLIEMELMKPFESKNPKKIEFESGGFVTFRTRRKQGLARGLTLDVIIYDEAQMVGTEMLAAMQPTLIHAFNGKRPGKELFYGTPPTRSDWNLYGRTAFAQAKIDKNPAYYEHSAAEEYDPKLPLTVTAYRKANPRGEKMKKEVIESIISRARGLGHEKFYNEYMGVWTFPKEMEEILPVLGTGGVSKIATKRATNKSYFYASVGLDDAHDQAYIVVNDGELMEAAGRFSTRYGSITELALALRESSHMFRKISIPAGYKGRGLVEELKKHLSPTAFKRVELVTLPIQAANLSMFIDGAEAKKFQVYDNLLVTKALGSFYTDRNKNSGTAFPKAILPEDTPLVVGFVNAVVPDGKERDSLDSFNMFGPLAS